MAASHGIHTGVILLFCCLLKASETHGSICTFDSDWCGYEQDSTDDFDWTRLRGGTPSSNTGPSSDHTGNGYYVYTEVTSKPDWSSARLLSPMISIDSRYLYSCNFNFWYHMYGSYVESLNVSTRVQSDPDTLIWDTRGNQGNSWNNAVVGFEWEIGVDFQIVYEAGRGTNYQGDVALDDISIPSCDIIGEFEPDLERPVVNGCPSDIKATVELGNDDVVVNWTEPTASDNADDSLDVIISHPSSTPFPIGTTGVAYIFRDSSGNSATCLFHVTVVAVDTTAPSIFNCSDDIKAEIELGLNTTRVNWNEPNATDLSGVPRMTRSHKPNDEFPLGITLVSYKFADNSNNVANCSFHVILEAVDTTPPTVTECPSDIASVGGRHVSWREPRVFDLSTNITITKSHFPGMFVIKETRVVYKFTDASNNTAFCEFTVKILYDETSPTISDCFDNITIHSELGNQGESVFWSQPSATDDNGRVMLIRSSHSPGESFPLGMTPVTYQFADDSYNVAYCNFSVIVDEVDTMPPTIHSCPSDIYQDIEPGRSGTPAYWIPPTATDVSGNVSLVSQSHQSGELFPPGRTEVVYLFIDGSDNKAKCIFYVYLKEVSVGNGSFVYVDVTPPIIVNCPADVHESTELGSVQVQVTWSEPHAVDLQGSTTLQNATHRPGDTFSADSKTEVTYVFTDESRNPAACTFLVIITTVDTTRPVVEFCPLDIDIEVEIRTPGTSVAWTEPSVTDVSENVTLLARTHSSGQLFGGGVTIVTYLYADPSNNIASCTFQIRGHIVDTTPPKVEDCPNDIHTVSELGNQHETMSWMEPLASDASGEVTLSIQSHVSGDELPIGTTEIYYLFDDKSGNTAWCNFTVTINTVDTRKPTISSCPLDIDTEVEIGSFGTPVTWTEPSVTDESGKATLLTKSHSSGNVFGAGVTTVTYLYTDPSNNIASCTFQIVARRIDTTSPKVENCPIDIHAVTELGNQHTAVSWIEPTASDASRNVTLSSQSHASGDDFPVGTTYIRYLFVDKSGNKVWCNFTVTIDTEDSTPPTISDCPSGRIAKVEEGSMSTSVVWKDPSATDASGDVTLFVKTHQSGERFGVGTHTVMYMFTDPTKNIATCTFSIRVSLVDTTPPQIFNCPSDIRATTEVGIPRIPVVWFEPFAVDGSGQTMVIHRSHKPGDNFAANNVTRVSYVFVDEVENRASCSFSVTVMQEDSTPPEVVSCPRNIDTSVDIGISSTSMSWDAPIVNDNSRDKVSVNSTHKSGDLFHVGSTLVSYVFTDTSNNSASCEFQICVSEVDIHPPSIHFCPSDTTVQTDDINSFGANVNWDEPVVEDTSGHVILLVQTHISGSFFAGGTTMVSYVFQDNAHNMAKCSFFVTVMRAETPPPSVRFCPSNKTEKVEDDGAMGATVNWDEPIVHGASGKVTLLIQTHASGSFFTIGSTIVSYVFRDDVNNMVTCSFSVTVTEESKLPAKILNCPSNIVTGAEPGKDVASVMWKEPYAINLSSSTKISSTHKPNESFSLGTTDVVYTFEKPGGSPQFCNFTVIVIRNEYEHEATVENKEDRAETSSVSYAALSLVLLMLIVILCAAILYFYVRKRSQSADNNDDVQLQGYQLAD